MAAQNWTLFDHSQNMHCGDNKKFGNKLSARLNVLKSGLSAGVEVVTLSNGDFSIDIIPTRGMNIWKAYYKEESQTEEIGWHSPVRGPVHPSFVPETEASGLGWLDGFDELITRCGLESNGAPEFNEQGQVRYPLHGRISSKPAYKLELTIDDGRGEITLTGWVEETRFHFLKVSMKTTIRLKANHTGFEIVDEITNLSASPAEIQMLYHVNFGAPLLGKGAEVIAPFKEVVPRNDHATSGLENWTKYDAPKAGTEEQVYFTTLQANDDGQTSALLTNQDHTKGAALSFNIAQLPCFTIWKNTTAKEDGYVTGIEPGTNYPNPRTFEGQQARVIKLEGNASTTLRLELTYCPNKEAVKKVQTQIKSLSRQPTITHTSPQPNWCIDT